MSELAFETAGALVEKIRGGEVSSVELLQHFFDRVDRFNGDINAVVVQIREEAMKRAREADAALARGEDWGPLHGLPMTVKESYRVAGTPSTWGAPHLKDNVADDDALSISRLRSAGAIIFGKTNVPLMLADFQSYNEIYGTTNNPWDLDSGAGWVVWGVSGGAGGGFDGTRDGFGHWRFDT